MPRPRKPSGPSRYFDSSPEAIRFVVPMYVKLNGEMVYLPRATDHKGEVLESYVARTRDKKAALAFMKKALKRHGSPEAFRPTGSALKARQ